MHRRAAFPSDIRSSFAIPSSVSNVRSMTFLLPNQFSYQASSVACVKISSCVVNPLPASKSHIIRSVMATDFNFGYVSSGVGTDISGTSVCLLRNTNCITYIYLNIFIVGSAQTHLCHFTSFHNISRYSNNILSLHTPIPTCPAWSWSSDALSNERAKQTAAPQQVFDLHVYELVGWQLCWLAAKQLQT